MEILSWLEMVKKVEVEQRVLRREVIPAMKNFNKRLCRQISKPHLPRHQKLSMARIEKQRLNAKLTHYN